MAGRSPRLLRPRYSLAAILLAFLLITLLCGVRSYRVQQAAADMRIAEHDPRITVTKTKYDYIGPDRLIKPLAQRVGWDPSSGNSVPRWFAFEAIAAVEVETDRFDPSLQHTLERFPALYSLTILSTEEVMADDVNLSGFPSLRFVKLVGEWIPRSDISHLLRGCTLDHIELYSDYFDIIPADNELVEQLQAQHPKAKISTQSRASYWDFRLWLENYGDAARSP